MNSLDAMVDAIPFLIQGLGITIYVSVISILVASVIGIIGCFMRMSKSPLLRYPVAFYLNAIRGTPILVQILFIYFGLPSVFDIQISAINAGLIAVSLNIGAYMTEIFRGGIESISKGQIEAGRSLGFSQAETMRLLILPQAVRRMIPAIVNQLTHSIKDTSMLSVIGVAELTMVGQSIYAMNFRTFEVLLVVAAFYFITIYAVSYISRVLERKFVIT